MRPAAHGGVAWVAMVLWTLLGVVIVIGWIVAIVDIVRRRHERTFAKTSAWTLTVLILPIVGTLLYFLVNGGFGSGPAGARDPDATRFGR
jgi:Phospholipase_D-nuclease N-terminal